MRAGTLAAGMLSLLSLGGCGGGQLSLGETGSTPAPVQAQQPFAMAGRWIVAAPNAPSCGMAFTGGPGVTAGKIAPEGGCPDRFFTSRNWAMDGTTLTIGNAESEALATLTFANGQFEGRSAAGMPIQLSRPAVLSPSQ